MGREQDLLEAARKGNIAVVEKILAPKKRPGLLESLRRPNVNCQDSSGYTPLHHAVLHGHKDIVDFFVRHDANPGIADNKGLYPLHLASWTGNAEIVQILLSTQKIKVNEQNSDGDTALHFAAQYGHTEVVKLLLKKHGRAANRNKNLQSPLDLGAMYGKLETVQLLLQQYPALLENSPPTHTPLHLAARNGHTHVVKALLDAGADINGKSSCGTALHEAALYGKLEVVRLLMEHGVDTTCRNEDKKTALEIVEENLSPKSQEISAMIKGIKRPSPISVPKPGQEGDRRSQLVQTPYDNLSSPDYQSISGSSSSAESSVENSPTGSHGYLNLPPMKTPPQKPARHSGDRHSMANVSPPKSGAERIRTGSLPASAGQQTKHSAKGKNQLPSNGSQQKEVDLITFDAEDPAYDEIPSQEDDEQSMEPKQDTNGSSETRKQTHENVQTTELRTSTSGGYSTSKAKKEFSFENSDIKEVKERPESVSTPPPPLPDRNYYDEEVAGTYEILRKVDSDQEKSEETPPVHSSEEQPVNANNGSSATDGDDRPNSLTITTPVFIDPTRTSDGEGIYELLSDATSGGPPSITSPTSSEASSVAMETIEKTRSFPLKPVPKKPTDLPLNNGTSKKPEQINNNVDKGAPHPPPPVPPHKNLVVSGYVEMTPVLTPTSPTEYDQPPTPDHPPPSANTASLEIHCKFHSELFETGSNSQRSSGITDITESSGCCSSTESESDEPDDVVVTTETTILTPATDQSNSDPQNTSAHLSTISEGTEDRDDSKRSAIEQRDLSMAVNSDKSSDTISISTDSSSEAEILRPEGLDPFAGLVYGSSYNRTPPPANFDLSPVDSPLKALSPIELSKVSQSTESLESPDFDKILNEADKSRGDMATEGGGGGRRPREESIFLDESKEWQQVSDILSSIGAAMVRESVYSRELEDQFAKMMSASAKPENVAQWLEKLGLPQYQHTFLTHGYDDLNFLNGKVLEEQDLIDIGVQEKNHRQLILESAKLLPAFKPYDDDSLPSSVSEWLKSINLLDYATRFEKMGFNTMQRVKKIWEVELTNVLDISTSGHRKRILASLGDRSLPRKPAARPLSFTLSKDFTLDWDLSPLEENGASNDSEDKSSQGSSSLENINLFKDYSKLKPSQDSVSSSRSYHSQHSYENVTLPTSPKGPEVPLRSSRIHKPVPYENVPLDPMAGKPFSLDPGNWSEDGVPIRSPKMANSQEELPMNVWKHSSDSLINSSCDYQASYLGSQLIRELKGTESTREACAKLRKSTKNMQKIPLIVLSMNYKGVKFIDAQTKNIITDHSIRNISCAAQDPAELRTFAYITRDNKVDKHYCHVFSVTNNDLAAEIILTLGQAFEVAYQMLVKEQSGDVNPLYKPADVNPLYQPQES
ncbi:ankyrin repeat and SAM domain-containing protein 1A-like isoform X2 [Ptychodera flava]|uniref:ankyrin repeat and SAM domain-containing protein 1A-like isoform X2 n=2 Tax=Ptychodera flava TaxID=63121 RepID=UPI00396A7EF9